MPTQRLLVLSVESQTRAEGKRHHAVISKQVQEVQTLFPSEIAMIAADGWATLVFWEVGHSYETIRASLHVDLPDEYRCAFNFSF